MKKLNYVSALTLSLALFIVSCDKDYDNTLPSSDEAGMIVAVTATTNSSILGSPEPGVDLAEAEVTITNASLDMTIRLASGSLSQISKIEVVKSFNGGNEIVLGETTTLPYNLVIDNLDDLLAGTGIVESDLRIGDILSFRTRITQTDGDVYYYSTNIGNYNLVVNCSSDLAGTYSINYSSGPQNHFVTEIGPGLYQLNSMMGWPTQAYWTNFTDTCGVLEIDNDWAFSGGNPAYAEGFVDASGNIVWTSVTVTGVYEGRAYTMTRQ